MPNLPDLKFHYQGKTGEELAFTSSASVKSDGEFSVSIPEVLLPLARHLIGKFPQVKLASHAHNAPLRFYAANLTEIKRVIAACAEEYLKCEVKKERVIVYSHVCHVSFWRRKDGSLCPSGVGLNHNSDGGWSGVGDLHATSGADHYSVGIFAGVYDRVVTTRGTMSKTTYVDPDDWDHFAADTWGQKLNSFCGLHMEVNDSLKRIPYTEEAAMFFYQTMMALCGMADRLDAFLKDDKLVQQAIASGAKNLLTSKE